MKEPSLYINSCGLINALGSTRKTVLENLIAGNTSGVVPWDIQVQDKTVYVGQISEPLPEVPARLAQFDCRNNQLILSALEQIDTEVEALKGRYASDRIAIVLGSSTSGILEGENALEEKTKSGQFPAAFDYRQQEIGTLAIFLREYLGLTGLAYTVSTACSSSAKVFANARRLLNSDMCDAVIVGGSDSLCRLTLNGFSSLESVSAGRCQPMSANRDGINIGEAAALFIVTREPSEIALLGVGESSDAHHMSAPHPQGVGAIQAMRAALDEAGLASSEVSYINMHGTATPLNDAMESIAIEQVFGLETPVSSTKPLVGHTLGAAGATEVGFCWLLLSEENPDGRLPPHIWDGMVDGKIPEINLVKSEENIAISSGTAFLSNSFAFGGNNASVIIGRI